MRAAADWIILAVYAACLFAAGRAGLQHTHFLMFLGALLALGLGALWALSLRPDDDGEAPAVTGPGAGPSEE